MPPTSGQYIPYDQGDEPNDLHVSYVMYEVVLCLILLLVLGIVSHNMISSSYLLRQPIVDSRYINQTHFRRNTKLDRTKLASRLPRDARELLHIDKLDKYLDIMPLLKMTVELSHCDVWDDPDILKHKSLLTEDTRGMMQLDGYKPDDLVRMRVDPTLPAKLLLDYTSDTSIKCFLNSSRLREIWSLCLQSSSQAVYYQLKHLISAMSPTLHGFNDTILNQWITEFDTTPPEILKMFAVSEDWMKILEINRQLTKYYSTRSSVDRIRQRFRDVNNHIFCPSFNAHFKLYPNLTIMTLNQREYLMNQDLLLECHNKACELFCVTLYSWLSSTSILPKTHLSQVIQFLRHLATVVAKFGFDKPNLGNFYYMNNGFLYLKAIEALGVSAIITREDTVKGWSNNALSNALWSGMVEQNLVTSETFEGSELYDIFKNMQVAQISEVIGLVKLCGHPSIDVETGLSKLYERTHNNITVDEIAVQRSIAILTRDLTKNFYRKHGKYPAFNDQNELFPRQLRTLIATNESPFKTSRGRGLWTSMTLDDWTRVIFSKNEEFDVIENRLPLLKDKAIGLTRTKAYKLLLTDIHTSPGSMMGSREQRRVLLQYLLSPYMDSETTTYLQSYANDTEWSQEVLDYMVIKLTPKELEEKVEGRMFGASPVPERNRRIIQEYNVMRLMDNYIDDQIMTPDELSMVRKLYSFRCFNAMYPNHSLLQVSFDFSRWNNNMRSDSIDVPGAAILDRWFGTKFYGKTMKFYQNALIYYNDGHNTRHWTGQEGGIEGLNQATWSFVFIGGIKQALEELGLSYQLTVKGDDVRAAIAIDNNVLQEQGPEMYKDWVLNQLLALCNQMGWVLNPQECFVSLSVIATSKQYQVNNTWLPASTKKIMKSLSLTNVIFPTVEDIVAGAFSTAHAAANQVPALLPAYAAATIVASRELLRRFSDVTIIQSQLTTLLLWPQCLGGPGALPLQTFFIRGENDMLSVSVSLLRYLAKSSHEELATLVTSILAQDLSSERDMRLLLMDPYSISLDLPMRPQALLKKLIRTAIKKYTKNEELIELLLIDTQNEETKWIEHLLSMEPYHAKVATVLWENSPFYLIEEILSKFMQSSTVFDFLCYKGNGRVDRKQGHKQLSDLLSCEKRRYNHWKNIIMNGNCGGSSFLGVPTGLWYNDNICTTELVHHIRKACWGKDIIGLTYPSLVDQNILSTPDDAAKMAPDWNMGRISNTVYIDLEACVYQTTDSSIHYAALPNHTPWLGSVTSGKARLPGLAARIQSPTISKIMKLLYLQSAGSDLGDEFKTTVRTALRALTTIDVSQLHVLDPEISEGHIAHRTAMNSYSMTTMPNSRPNLLQIAKMEETCPVILRGDLNNRTINYAARYYYCIFMSLMPLQMDINLPPGYPKMIQVVFHEDVKIDDHYSVCPYCCNIVDSGKLTFKNKSRPTLIQYCKLGLVGESQHDHNILVQAITEAITTRARKYATEMYQDPGNPIIQSVATHVILSQFGRNAQKVFEAAMGSGFQRVPKGALLEALSVTMGVRSLSSLSINLLRCTQPDFLYEFLVSTMVQWFISNAGLEPDSSPFARILQMQSHLNPMAGLFAQLTTAGVMKRIITGGQIVKGPDFVLRWGPQDLRDSNAAVQTFIRYHEDTLTNLCDNPEEIENMKLFIDLESHEEVKKRIQGWRDNTRLFITSQVFRHVNSAGYFKVFAWGQACHHLHISSDHNIWSRTDVADLIEHFYHRLVTQDEHNHVVGWIYGLMQLHTVLYPIMNACEEDDSQLEFSNIVELFQSNGTTLDDEIDWSEAYILNHPSGLALSRKFVAVKIEIMFEVVKRILNEDDTEIQLRGYRDMKVMVLRLIRPINKLKVLCMTTEDAERVVKSKNYDIVRAAKEAQRLHEHDLADDNEFFEATERCQYRGDGSHHPVTPKGSLVFVDRPQNIQSQILVVRDGLSLVEPPFAHSYIIDSVDLARSIGYNNTSVSKFAEILDLSGFARSIRLAHQDCTIICAADGLGGVTALCLTIFPMAHVIYNSLYVISQRGEETGDANVYNPPTEVLALPACIEWQSRLQYEGLYPGDICESGVRQNITNAVIYSKKNVHLLTFDAEIPRDDELVYAAKLWSSLVNMIRLITNPHLHVIIKIFALQSVVVFRILNSLCGMFKHFHIKRCDTTRSHSTEIFFIGSRPILPMKDKLEEYVLGTVNFSERSGINTYIAHVLRSSAGIFNNARTSGIGYNPPLALVFNSFRHLNIYPTPIACHSKVLGLNVKLPSIHLCGIWAAMSDKIAYRIRQLDQLLITLSGSTTHGAPQQNSARQSFQVRGVKNNLIAQGPSAALKYIKSYWRVISMQYYWKLFNDQNLDLNSLTASSHYSNVLRDCLTLISNHPLNQQCTINLLDGETFLHIENLKESVTKFLRVSIQKCMQMIGVQLYMCTIVSHAESSTYDHLSTLAPGSELLTCCHNRCKLLNEKINTYRGGPQSTNNTLLHSLEDWIILVSSTGARLQTPELIEHMDKFRSNQADENNTMVDTLWSELLDTSD